MPIRPRQHHLEDISINEFKRELPESWIVREKNKDYGIDLEVEIVDENHQPTGHIFLVQLKATDSKRESDIKAINIPIDTLKYYRNFSQPIMLVRYASSSKLFYYRWVNNVDMHGSKKNGKTFKIAFNDENVIKHSSWNDIEAYYNKFSVIKQGKLLFPVPMKLEFKGFFKHIGGQVLFESQIEFLLNKHKRFLEIKRGSENCLLNVVISPKQVSLSAAELYGFVMHFSEKELGNEFNQITVEYILIGLAHIMHQSGQFEQASRVIVEADLLKLVGLNFETLNYLLPSLLRSSHIKLILEELDKVSYENQNDNLQLALDYCMLTFPEFESERVYEAIEGIRINRIKRELVNKDSRNIAIAYYNLGSFYRSRNDNLKAIRNYKLAFRSDSLYSQQHYFFTELAGVLFLSNRYKLSAKLYKIGSDLHKNTDSLHLYGDALFMSGHYRDSHEILNQYINSTDTPIEEFVLKVRFLEYLINQLKIDFQMRDSKRAIELINSEIEKPNVENLAQALKCDYLCSEAWYKLAIIHSNDKDIYNAYFAFLSSALISCWNVNAWSQATVLSIIMENNESDLIIRTAFSLNREEFVIRLMEILNMTALPQDFIKHLKEHIEKLTESIIKDQKPKSFRMLDDNGNYINLIK